MYDDIKKDEYSFWTDEKIKSSTSATTIKEQLEAAAGVEQINIYINSNGGSVKEGMAIYNQLIRHPAHKTVYVDGFACSIASVIAQAGDERVMGDNTLMMIHNAAMGAYGNSKELRKAADDLDVINEASCKVYKEKTKGKLSEEELEKMLDNETWLTAEDCIKYGLADKLYSDVKKDDEPEQKKQYEEHIRQQKADIETYKPSQNTKVPDGAENPFNKIFNI